MELLVGAGGEGAGFTAAYPTQSSIPFKHQTSVIPESEKKGFNSQAKRFCHKKVMTLSSGFCTCLDFSLTDMLIWLVQLSLWPAEDSVKQGATAPSPAVGSDCIAVSPSPVCQISSSTKQESVPLPPTTAEQGSKDSWHFKDDVPGPGFYNVIHQSPVSNSVSLSKKVTCTFPSMRARLATIISKYPAANAYTIPSHFVSKKDFSNSCSSMFQLPSFAKVLKFETPAPNHYNASVSCCKQKNNVCARAGFMSKTQRGFFTTTDTVPAPGKPPASLTRKLMCQICSARHLFLLRGSPWVEEAFGGRGAGGRRGTKRRPALPVQVRKAGPGIGPSAASLASPSMTGQPGGEVVPHPRSAHIHVPLVPPGSTQHAECPEP
ncbi:hypothetical protein MC885_009393 [Smutsia gigantea]|nr:hypothetical protein MC885_009393 [Smutsia gigantea]